ncbi:MAG: IclR family transcriptional regulator [Sciscionella sp.]
MSVAGAKTLDSGLRILWLLAEHPDGLPIGALATRLGLDRNAVRRMLAALREGRLVARTEAGYQLGLGVVELGMSVRSRLRAAADVALHQLAGACGATAFLTSLDGDARPPEAVVVAVVEPAHSFVHVAYRVGLRHPADHGASGIAILAGRPAQAGERAEVDQARRRGYAVTSGELQVGAWGLAAPVAGGDTSVGVVSIGELEEAATARRVCAAAAEVAALLPARR